MQKTSLTATSNLAASQALLGPWSKVQRRYAIWGASLAALAVMLGAFGAHTLANYLTEARLATFETAVRYQMYHGIAILAISALPLAVQGAVPFLLAGTLIFSGSLYLLIASNVSVLGAITPLGGVLQIIGWFVLIYRLWRLA
ncbi:MAG: DUF423 domain-containing protein [Deinococcales bacterium]